MNGVVLELLLLSEGGLPVRLSASMKGDEMRFRPALLLPLFASRFGAGFGLLEGVLVLVLEFNGRPRREELVATGVGVVVVSAAAAEALRLCSFSRSRNGDTILLRRFGLRLAVSVVDDIVEWN